MRPVFKPDGVVTAGSASGVCDGAGAVVLASEQACKEDNLKPLARLVGYSTVGVPPEIMGIGPVQAIQNLLKKTGLSLNDIDLIEVSIEITKKKNKIYVSDENNDDFLL